MIRWDLCGSWAKKTILTVFKLGWNHNMASNQRTSIFMNNPVEMWKTIIEMLTFFYICMSQNGAGSNISNILKLTYWLYFSSRSMDFHSISLVAMLQSFPSLGDFATKFHSACSLLQWTTPLRSTHLIRHTRNKTHGNTMKQIDTNISSFLWNWSVKLVIC